MTNARKSRERHRVEEVKAFEQERIDAMAARNEIYNCSGTQIHLPNCNGECGIRKLGELEIEINKEHKRWAELGMVPQGSMPQMPQIPGIPINTFKMETALSTLTQAVIEELGLDEDKLNERFQKMYLDRLVMTREANEEQIKAAKARAQIAPVDLPNLLVPDYIKKKH